MRRRLARLVPVPRTSVHVFAPSGACLGCRHRPGPQPTRTFAVTTAPAPLASTVVTTASKTGSMIAADTATGLWYTLGLDVNTHTIGFAVLDDAGRCVQRGIIDTADIDDHQLKLAHIHNQLQSLYHRYHSEGVSRWWVGIEQYLRAFQMNRTHTASLFALAERNAVVTYIASVTFHSWPVKFHPSTARSMFGLAKSKASPAKKSDVKAIVWAFVDGRLMAENGGAPVDWTLNRRGKLDVSQYDVSDAYIIALATFTASHQQPPSSPVTLDGDSEEKVIAKKPRKKRAIKRVVMVAHGE